METDLPDRPVARPLLDGYFPWGLRERFAEHFAEHALRREIVATAAANHVVNQAGVTFLSRVMAASRAGIGDVVAAYLEVERESGAPAVREQIQAAGASSKKELDALLEVEGALESLTRSFLAGKPADAGRALARVRARLAA
jgi:glutamate dehydrogenase